MTFKPPGGELTVWTILWGLSGLVSAAVTTGLPFRLMGGLIFLSCFGMWMRWPFARLALLAMMCLRVVTGVLGLLVTKVTVTKVVFLMAAAYFIVLLLRSDEEPPA